MAMPYCLICHNIFIQTEAISSTPCGHVYHNECLLQWFNSSQTCPQCRQDCDRDNIRRIYIDFASDEDLALGNAQSIKVDADAEETIKLLLEHIDALPEKEEERNDECEFCKSILEAFDDLQAEKQKLENDAIEKTREGDNLAAEHNKALKCIEELQLKIKASEKNLLELKEQLDTLEKVMHAIDSENLLKDDIIRDNDSERKMIQQQVHELNKQLEDITNKHMGTDRILQIIFKGAWPSKVLNMYRFSQHIKRLHINEEINCQALSPFCGNIGNWEYMLIPVIKNAKPTSRN